VVASTFVRSLFGEDEDEGVLTRLLHGSELVLDGFQCRHRSFLFPFPSNLSISLLLDACKQSVVASRYASKRSCRVVN